MHCCIQEILLVLILLQRGSYGMQKSLPGDERLSHVVSVAASTDSTLLRRLAKCLLVIAPQSQFHSKVKLSQLGATSRYSKRYAITLGAVPPRPSDDDSLGDWREMRARLVQQERARQQGVSPKEIKDSSWAFESTLIEQGSVLLAGPKQIYGYYGQQYFHKSVLLILEHSEYFTRGIIMNRPTAYEIDGWRVWMGGDVATGDMFGNQQQLEFSEFYCLHSLQDDFPSKVSMDIMKGVKVCSLQTAKVLVAAGAARKSDFCVFVGYAGWGPGQLQSELDRESWLIASAGSGTLLQELLRQGLELSLMPAGTCPNDGISVWERLMTSIGRQAEADATRGNQLDKNLARWVREKLVPFGFDNSKDALLAKDVPNFAMSRSDAIVATIAAILFNLRGVAGKRVEDTDQTEYNP